MPFQLVVFNVTESEFLLRKAQSHRNTSHWFQQNLDPIVEKILKKLRFSDLKAKKVKLASGTSDVIFLKFPRNNLKSEIFSLDC